MRKYCSNEGNNENEMTTQATSAPPVTGTTKRPAFSQFIDKYNRAVDAGDTSLMEQTIDEEFNSYATSVPKRPAALDPIKFWEVSFTICNFFLRIWNLDNNSILKTNHETFPTLFKIAMDYLPIQASAVPCEQIFSSSAETDTKKRNRI